MDIIPIILSFNEFFLLREFGSTYLSVAFDDDDLFKYQYYFHLRRSLCFRAAIFLL
jgi:hypothetical protein